MNESAWALMMMCSVELNGWMHDDDGGGEN